MKPSDEMIAALEKCGVEVSVDEDMMRITYYTKHGGEEDEEIPASEFGDANIAGWLRSAYDNYDVSYETYIWLDDTGHGSNGAPHEMKDVLSDKKEWENKLSELADAADSVAFG